MASKRVVRKVAPAHLADFDEQLWPINLVLLILGGFVAGIVLAKSDFQATRLINNGWVHLATLTVTLGLLAWGVVWLQGRMQRRLQLGVFLSLLAHLWLCMLGYNVYLSLIAERQASRTEVVDEEPPVTLPEYHWQDQAQQVASDPTLETPTSVETPEPAVEAPQPTAEEPVPAEREPQPEPAAEQREPSPIEMERAEVSAPHRSERLAGAEISRVQRTADQPLEQVAAPEMQPQTQEEETLVAHVAPQERQQAEESANRPEPSELPLQPDVPQQHPTDARRPAPEAPATETRETPLASREARAAEAVQTDADPVTPQPEAQPADQTPAPAVAELARRENTPAARTSPAPAENPTEPMAPAESAPRRTRSADQPRLEVAVVAPARPQAIADARPSPAPQPAVAPAASEPTDVVAPAEVAMARSEASSPAPSELPAVAAPGSAAAVPATQAERAAASDAPAVATGAPTASRARSRAPVDAAAETVEIAAAGDAAAETAVASEPATTGLTRADGGSPGLTRERQYESDAPGEGPQTPSAAAATAASQADDPGPALSPSAPAQIARSRAAADAPSATLPIEDATIADAAGSAAPAAVEASASAALTRRAAAAPRGRVTADAGASAVDLAQPVVAARAGAGETSGGGEPSIGAGGASSPLARAATTAATGGESAAIPELTAPAASESAGATGPAIGELSRAETPGLSDRPASESSPEAGQPAAVAAGAAALGEARRDETAPTAALATSSLGPRATAASDGLDATVEDAPSASELAAAGAPAETADDPPSSDAPDGRFSAAPRIAGEVGQPRIDRPEPGAEATGADDARLARADGPVRAAAGSPSDPSIGDATRPVAPRARSTTAGLPRGDASVDEPELEAQGAPAASGGGEPVLEVAMTEGRRRAAGLPVEISAPDGPGGLAARTPGRVGLPGIRARPESDIVHMAASRLIIEKSGGRLAAEVRVQDTAVPGLRQRDRAKRSEVAELHGGSAQTERAVEMGLEFLARHQSPDGSWSLRHFGQGRRGYEKAGAGQMQSDTAGTGLALLAFLGAGNTHTDGKYRAVVGRALGYLLAHQKPDGDLFVPADARSNLNVWLYSHGIASISLCEAYGMTLDPLLRDPAQKALDFIVASQSPDEGGWRYSPRQGSDTSVSGWQLMALKSGELAGLNAPPECYERVRHWLDGAQGQDNPALYVYRPKSDQKHQRTTSRVMTAEALLMRQYLGWQRDNPYMTAGADYLRANLPKWGTAAGRERDAYYWYYATQVMFQMGGPHWQDWNEHLRSLLIDSQTTSGQLAGSWDPLGPTPDRWGREGGRIYVTAMHLLMLEVYYRHLPLYDNLNASSAAE